MSRAVVMLIANGVSKRAVVIAVAGRDLCWLLGRSCLQQNFAPGLVVASAAPESYSYGSDRSSILTDHARYCSVSARSCWSTTSWHTRGYGFLLRLFREYLPLLNRTTLSRHGAPRFDTWWLVRRCTYTHTHTRLCRLYFPAIRLAKLTQN